MPLTFGLSRDPYLVANRPIMKNLGSIKNKVLFLYKLRCKKIKTTAE